MQKNTDFQALNLAKSAPHLPGILKFLTLKLTFAKRKQSTVSGLDW